MSALVSPESVVGFYRELWVSVHGTPAPEFLSPERPLPPFLCRALAFGDPPLTADCTWSEAMTGTTAGTMCNVAAGDGGRGVFWGVSGISPRIFTDLPLGGHAIAEYTDARRQLLADALALIASLGGPYLATVCDFIGLILWLRPDGDAPGAALLTSSSFPALPHCAFTTDSAAQEILPNTVLAGPSPWPLAENLYHEALHQRLSATILQSDIFPESFEASSGPKIDATWRDQSWPLDRALHAFYVYTELLEMRRALLDAGRLSGAELAHLQAATAQSVEARDHLGAGLDRHRDCLTEAGNALLTELA